MNYTNNPIFVTGIERSGSSIIAKIIRECGAFTGTTTPMLENKGIKKLVDHYYESVLKIPIFGQYPLPNVKGLYIPPIWKSEVENSLIYNDGYNKDLPWMYKSARIAQIYPLWKEAYPNAKYIIVRRRTGDIIHSCLKTGFMVAFNNIRNQKLVNVSSEQEGWLWWVQKQEETLYQITKSENCQIVWPERIANGDYGQMKEVISWLGLQWKEEIVEEVSILLKHSILKERGK